MANIAKLIEAVSERLDDANYTEDDRRAAGHVLVACAQLLEIMRLQEERNKRVAEALDELAKRIDYPITSIHEMREQVRQVAAIVRGERTSA